MGTNQDYKNKALESLRGHWGSAVITTLIVCLIGYIPYYCLSFAIGTDNPLSLTSFLWFIVITPIFWSYTVMFLGLVRTGDEVKASGLLEGFSDFNRIFMTKLLQMIYVLLWSLLFIIPGIIKEFSYALTDFILKDNPELGYNAAIEESMRLMKGHKAKLFWLFLSFIGWAILSTLTLGLGYLLLYPYWQTSFAHFYEDLKAQDAA